MTVVSRKVSWNIHVKLNEVDKLQPNWFHSCLPRTEMWGYSVHGLSETGQILPNLMNLDFCCDTEMIGSEIGISRMNLPCVNSPGCFWWSNGVVDIFFQLFNAVMSIWTRISKKSFQHLMESMSWGIEAVLRAKAVLPRIIMVFLIKWLISV